MELEYNGPEISDELRDLLISGNPMNSRLMDSIFESNRARRDNPLDFEDSDVESESSTDSSNSESSLEDSKTRKLDSSSEQENSAKKIKISKDDKDGDGENSGSGAGGNGGPGGTNNTGGDNGPDLPESSSSKVISYLVLSISGVMSTFSETIGNLF